VKKLLMAFFWRAIFLSQYVSVVYYFYNLAYYKSCALSVCDGLTWFYLFYFILFLCSVYSDQYLCSLCWLSIILLDMFKYAVVSA